MRPGDEGGKSPVGFPEPRDCAAEDQPPIDPYRLEDGLPDRRGEVALDEILEAEEVVGSAGLPVLSLGLDGPGGDLAVGDALRTADGGAQAIEPTELAQLGPEHAVVLRQTARIVAL